MNFYKFHLDQCIMDTEIDIQFMLQFFKAITSEEYHVVFELGRETKKPHFQGYFQTIEHYKELNLRKEFKKHFPILNEVKGKGQQVYSIKLVEDEKHIDNYKDYMFKGNDICHTTLSTKYIEEQHVQRTKLEIRKEEKVKKEKDDLPNYSRTMLDRYSIYLKETLDPYGKPIYKPDDLDYSESFRLCISFVTNYVQANSKIHNIDTINKWVLLLMSREHKLAHSSHIMSKLHDMYNL